MAAARFVTKLASADGSGTGAPFKDCNTRAGEPDTPLYRGVLRGETIVRKHGIGADAGVVFEHVTISPQS